MLSDEDRRLVFTQCARHRVALCPRCHTWWGPPEVAPDLFRDGPPRCTECKADLTEEVQRHVGTCELIRRSRELIKESLQLRDASDARIAESREWLDRERRELSARPSGVRDFVDVLLDSPRGQCVSCLAGETGIAVDQIERRIQRLERHVQIVVREGVCEGCHELRRLFAFRHHRDD